MVCGRRKEIADYLMSELREFDLLCSAVGDGDGTGKLRGKLSRLHAAVTTFQGTGDLGAFRDDLRSATAFVEHLHSLDPLTRLRERLCALERHMAKGDSRA